MTNVVTAVYVCCKDYSEGVSVTICGITVPLEKVCVRESGYVLLRCATSFRVQYGDRVPFAVYGPEGAHINTCKSSIRCTKQYFHPWVRKDHPEVPEVEHMLGYSIGYAHTSNDGRILQVVSLGIEIHFANPLIIEDNV